MLENKGTAKGRHVRHINYIKLKHEVKKNGHFTQLQHRALL